MRTGMRAPSVIAVKLDPVGAVADLVAHDAGKAVDAIGFLGPLRDAPFKRVALRTVAAGSDDRARGRKHAGTGNDALLDSLLEFYVGVSGALGAKIANRREARHQCRRQVIDGARGAQRETLVRNLIVPRCLVVGMQQDMRVPLDQSRQQRRARQLYDLRVRDAGGCLRTGGLDPIPFHSHRPTLMHDLAVEDARRLNHHAREGFARCRPLCRPCFLNQAWKQPDYEPTVHLHAAII